MTTAAPTAQIYSSAVWGAAKLINGETVKTYPVHKYQGEALSSECRFTACIAGTGGGKTALGALWLYQLIAKNHIKYQRPDIYMVVAPTYKVLERATVPALIETFKGTGLEGTYKLHKNLYETPYGDKIWCQGADNAGGLEGGQFAGVWADEAGQLSLPVWDAIQGRTGAKRSPIFLTTTPYAFNWLYLDFYKRWQKGDPDYKVIQWNSIENPTYSKEEYERAKRTMTPDKFKMRYQGRFERLEGMVYPNIKETVCDLHPEDILEMDGYIYGGIDYGWNDPFAAVAALLDKDDVLWIFYERYLPETTIEEHAEALPTFLSRRPRWWSDHHPEYIKKLRRGGHDVRKAITKSLTVGIDAVNARINTDRLRISQYVTMKSMPAFVMEGLAYFYPEKDGEFVGDKPDPNCADHLMDASRYMVVGIDIKKAA